MRAWGRGDRIAAGSYADSSTVDQLWAAGNNGGADWSFIGCDNAGPRPACTYSSAARAQRLVLFYDANLLGRAQAVTGVQFLPR